MELIEILEFNGGLMKVRIFRDNSTVILTNVDEHNGPVYNFCNPAPGTEEDRFLLKYTGNTVHNGDQHAMNIYLKHNEESYYLISSKRASIELCIEN